MEKITLSGKILFSYNGNYDKILLVSENGFTIDLINRVAEIKISWPNKKIQVNYWLSDNYSTKNKMVREVLERVYGNRIEAEYEDNGYMGSSMTGYCPSWDTLLRFGGHDLFLELKSKEGKFLIIEFNVE